MVIEIWSTIFTAFPILLTMCVHSDAWITDSAFPYESFLSKVRRKIRGPNNPVVQVFRRLSEASNVNTADISRLPKDDIDVQLKRAPKTSGEVVRQNTVIMSTVTLS